ncbi:MAG: rubredoxin [Leptolyngbya sp. DLM2.Bin15]|nr:MAG: rubredoxin [Leptolyngbya sp. DLM2.Bin15]
MTTDAADSGETNPTPAADVTGQADESADHAPEALDPKDLDRYECRSCGYIYEPVKGDGRAVEPGTPFEDLSIVWRCPVCSARASQFSNIGPTGNPSGFKENLGYGLGVNRLTPGQKNILIFSALGLGVLFFLSLYGLK